MKLFAGVILTLALVGGVGAWSRMRLARPGSTRTVGTSPGGVRPGRVLLAFKPVAGDSLVGFSAGCFWGSEEAFRKMPGIVATAVGYTGGTSAFPTEAVAHRTGHLETVLVEFDPKRTPFAALLKTFWTLPQATESDSEESRKSACRAAIWTYDPDEKREAELSRAALEKTLHRKLKVQIRAAKPFYLAEDFHQQYDEKAGKELCPAIP